jgi:hypothetical protein
MHLDHVPAILASLAGSAVGAFVLAVVIDDALGVIGAIKSKTFDVHKLASFLESQFGTQRALALLGLIAAAYFAGGDARQAALAALAAGGGAMTASVAADIIAKIKALVSGSPAPAAAAPAKAA